MNFMFFVSSFLLGVSLSMDAFSVSIANGLSDEQMKKSKMLLIAGTFAVFQGIMPLIGWICVHYLISVFEVLEKFVPYVALGLLLAIGIKMIVDGCKNKGQTEAIKVGFWGLIVQAIATSIDALSVGLTFATYNFLMVLVAIIIISFITFIICFFGIIIGKKVGNKLAGKESIFGGIILILIGIEIFLTGII